MTDNMIELDIPLVLGRPPLTANDRRHWAQKASLTRMVREAVCWRAREHKLNPQGYVIVQLHYTPPDRRRRDPSNLMPTQKPAVDGLVDAGVVPDDTPEYVGELMPVIHPPSGTGPRMWLAVAIRVLRPVPLSLADLAAIDEDTRFERAFDAAQGEDQ
jgi:crossover junction endodeoxyribonuclease RusA